MLNTVRATVVSCELINKYLTAALFNRSGCQDVLIGSAHNELPALEINRGNLTHKICKNDSARLVFSLRPSLCLLGTNKKS